MPLLAFDLMWFSLVAERHLGAGGERRSGADRGASQHWAEGGAQVVFCPQSKRRMIESVNSGGVCALETN